MADISDPYDGYNRCLPAAPFLPALMAECAIAAVRHSLEAVGPKYGATHRHVLASEGRVWLDPSAPANRGNFG